MEIKTMKVFDKEFVVKPNRVIMKNVQDRNIVIPSPMFPLNGPYELFYSENTEEIDSSTELGEECLKAFDALKPEIGHCYTNMERLSRIFQRRNLPLETYVGWMFLDDDSAPIHHCFGVFDGNKVLDPAVLTLLKLLESQGDTNKDVKKIQDVYDGTRKQPNHEKFTCGKVDEFYFYVASKCDPTEGRQIFHELRKTYPNHFAYENMNQKRIRRIQKIKV